MKKKIAFNEPSRLEKRHEVFRIEKKSGIQTFFLLEGFLLGNTRLSPTILGLKDPQSASQQFDGSLNKIGRVVNPGWTVRRQEFRYEHCISGLRCFI